MGAIMKEFATLLYCKSKGDPHFKCDGNFLWGAFQLSVCSIEV